MWWWLSTGQDSRATPTFVILIAILAICLMLILRGLFRRVDHRVLKAQGSAQLKKIDGASDDLVGELQLGNHKFLLFGQAEFGAIHEGRIYTIHYTKRDHRILTIEEA